MNKGVGLQRWLELGKSMVFIMLFFCVGASVAHAQDTSLTTIPFNRLAVQAEQIDPDAEEHDGSAQILQTLRETKLLNGKTYADWETFSVLSKLTVAEGKATTDEFEDLRRELVAWREVFLDYSDLNDAQISTLDSQIEALSPSTTTTNANGEQSESEDPVADVVQQRLDRLKKERSILAVPSLAASEGYELATGLVREIDSIINARRRSEFLETTPSPVLPTYWDDAVEYLYNFVAIVPAEMRVAWHKQDRPERLSQNAPQIVILLLIATVILLRSRRWQRRLEDHAESHHNASVRWLLMFVFTGLTTFAPLVAILMLMRAVVMTGLLGSHGNAIVQGLSVAAIMFFTGSWLGSKIFPRSEVGIKIVDLSSLQRTEGRFYARLLGLIFGFVILIIIMADVVPIDDGPEAVIFFPCIVGASLLSFRIAQLFRRGVEQDDEAEGAISSRNFRNQLVSFLSGVVMIPACAAPILAVFGYFNAATMISFPLIPSLALLAFLLVLQYFANEIYDVVVGRQGAAAEAIVPVVIGFFLALASVPMFAVILGVRPAQIVDYWNLFLNGVSFGNARISPESFMLLVIVFAIGYMFTRLIQGALRSTLLPKTKLDIGGQNAIVSGFGYVGIFLAGLVAIMIAGIDLSALALVAGALTVGIGFGLQNIVSNFVSGIILLVERPISEGDWIEAGGQMGYVRNISVRSTRIETFDRTDVIIPNGDLVAGVVTNWTRGNSIGRLILPVGVSYDADSKQVEKILLEIAKAHPMALASPEPTVLFRSFGDSSLNFEVRVILRDVNWSLIVQSELNHEILRRFNEEGISIPFPQTDLWLRNPESLTNPRMGPRPQPKDKPEEEQET
ncbi:mechanosensitive ion channel family protein [Falsihalocynthiibacter sp. SS001]|uniref:mechanosensitive ion channel family protein n=1 Tax=Falsihalocynthiibacter sp. SS001 TaxID=3349698 RepID=UPI0036D26208